MTQQFHWNEGPSDGPTNYGSLLPTKTKVLVQHCHHHYLSNNILANSLASSFPNTTLPPPQ
jgi:hypothetical protein